MIYNVSNRKNNVILILKQENEQEQNKLARLYFDLVEFLRILSHL